MRHSGKFYLAVLIVFCLSYAITGQGPNRTCTDHDKDGFAIEGDSWGNICGPVDCDDSNPDVNPDAIEAYIDDPPCSDGIDNDCDGEIDGTDWGCLPWEPVSILVRADPLFPGEIDGFIGGDPIADAEVEIIRDETTEIVATGFTDINGELILEVPSHGYYDILVRSDTTDPDCWWRGRISFIMVTEPKEATVNVWPDGMICAGPPVEVSILVRVNPNFPGSFGDLVGGDPVPFAEVEIIRDITGEIIASGFTDTNGKLALEVPGIGPYSIHGMADTVDPYCWWAGGFDILVLETELLDVTLDVGLLCA